MINTTIIDRKYIGLLTNRLNNFRDKGNGLYEFSHSCERQQSNKRRGYFYVKGNGYNFFCHNCQASTRFFKFLENLDGNLFKEYRLEVFKNEKTEPVKKEVKVEEPVVVKVELTDLIPYSELPKKHPAWKFVLKRKLPESCYSDIYFCKNFHKWASQYNKAFENSDIEEPRLILPYRNKKGDIIGFTCRAYGRSKRKYLEIKLTDEEMIFGLNKVDFSKDILCVEGPIDSLFLDNCIAVGGASYRGKFFDKYKNKLVIIPDNDWKRNKDVCKQVEILAKDGYRISLLPDDFNGKDINKGIENGYTKNDIHGMIIQNIKQGLELLFEISTRRKC